MNKVSIALAVLLAGAAVPALAQAPAQNNAQAGIKDTGNNAAPNLQTQASANTQAAANMTPTASVGISSEPSATQRKGTHLTAAQRAKADADEAETTRQLNQQAALLAKPGGASLQ